MTIVTVGIDLAKNVFAVHGVNQAVKPELVRPDIRRTKLLELIVSLPPCLIGMEACSGAHHWAREFQKFGHTVRIMVPKFVAPYRMGGKHGKNDAADAAEICEAVARPNMRFVPIKTIEQQGQLFVHRAHQGYVSERVALSNRIRGMLSELGIVLPQSFKVFQVGVHRVLEDLPGYCNQVIGDLMSELGRIQERIAQSERQIQLLARDDAQAQRLMRLRGIGPATASAIVASIGNGHDFKNGRQFSAWLGLVPRQHNPGARPSSVALPRRAITICAGYWCLVSERRWQEPSAKPTRLAAGPCSSRSAAATVVLWVAIATKNARMCWAALHLQEQFKALLPEPCSGQSKDKQPPRDERQLMC